MVVQTVFRDPVGKGMNVGIIAIRQDPQRAGLEKFGQEMSGPVNPRLGGPGVVGMTIETVYEDDVHLRLLGTIDLSQAKLHDSRSEVGHGFKRARVEIITWAGSLIVKEAVKGR